MKKSGGLVVLASAAASMVACVKALPAQDVTRLRDSEKAFFRIYQMPGAPPAAKAYARAGFCLVDKTLRNADAGTFDSKGAIECEEQK